LSTQLPLLNIPPSLNALPSAKLKKDDKVGVHAWSNFYAAFSENFSNHALRAIGAKSSGLLLDPFVGSGTTLVSALKLGIPAIGIDLDPFSCLLARAKIAINANLSEAKNLLKPTNNTIPLDTFCSEAFNHFDNDCLCYASAVFDRVLIKTNSNRHEILDVLLSDKSGKFDSEVVALTALCLGSSKSTSLIKGSNPTWYRKAIHGEINTFEKLYVATESSLHTIINDLNELRLLTKNRDILILNKNFRHIDNELSSNSIDLIVTSPPYLTRIDYVVKHLPNLLLLTGLINIDLDNLRKDMIGTTKIIDKSAFNEEWGEKCLATLKMIQEHTSYASNSYYIWTYSQYFKAMFESINILFRKTKMNFKGIMVAQNSFYKDVQIPLSIIVEEMFHNAGFKAKIIKKDSIKTKMSHLNPNQSVKSKTNTLSEDVIYFEK